jgi:ubiquinone/menaquinone biosynthesis C-methylase UbiE
MAWARKREPEWMDEPTADPRLLAKSLRFIRRINHWLGYTRATLQHLQRFSKHWRRDQIIRIVDLATGSADVPRDILKWADRFGWNVRIVAVDLHSHTIAEAAAESVDPRLSIVQSDAMQTPFASGSFDYAICSMFLHHLDEAEAMRVLREMDRLASRGVIVADLLRHRRACAWVNVLSMFSNRMVRHDARVSVAQAFTRPEILRLRDRSGISHAQYYRHFGHRFVLAGERI